MQIDTQQGSATSPRPGQRGVVIAHLCNTSGGWGRGFVLAVNELSAIPRKAYKECAQRHSGNIPLGETQFCEVEPDLWVSNMIAQNGLDKSAVANGVLVDYAALEKCLLKTFARAVSLGCDVHIPAGMGSGLAGGDETMIHDMIKKCATSMSITLLEQRMTFRPVVTLWEFQDTTAASFVGKSTALNQAKVASVFGTPDDTVLDMDDILNGL